MDPNRQKRRIAVQITNNFKSIDISAPKLKKLVKIVCNNFTRYAIRNTQYDISIAIVNDAEIRKINKQFLNHDCPTDVISFDLSDKDTRSVKTFELVVNAEKAAREANQRGHSVEAELSLYVTHGLLHNLGFDDSTKGLAKKMHDTEDKILQQLGFGLVYNRSTKNV